MSLASDLLRQDLVSCADCQSLVMTTHDVQPRRRTHQSAANKSMDQVSACQPSPSTHKSPTNQRDGTQQKPSSDDEGEDDEA